MPPMHFLIVGLDGLRVDMMTPELTPHLWRLAQQGAWLQCHHAAFPTATRVNVTSLVTGSHSGRHGVVNNSIYEPGVVPDQPVDMGKYHLVEAADAFYQGRLLSTPSLGEVLAAHGDTMVAVSAGTTGSNRLMHHKVKEHGGIGFSTQSLEACYPRQEAEAIVQRFGTVPAAALPDAQRLAYITRVWCEHFWPTYRPRVSILWFSDPDKTSHYRGVGAPDTLESIAAADAQIGHILSWMATVEGCDNLNLILLSDHGHITVKEQLGVAEALSAAGMPAAEGHFGAGDLAVVPGATGSIHVRHRDAALTHKVTQWLQEQPWCGAIFTAGKNAVEGIVPGTLAQALVCNDHPRTGDIVYTMRTDEERDAYGVVGRGYDDSNIEVGMGTHGGLSSHELRNICVAYGPAFRQHTASTLASGTIDLMPTLLHLLHYPIPATAQGRVLGEILAQAADLPELQAVAQEYSAEVMTASGLYRQHLETTRVGSTVHLERAWVS